MPKLTLAPLAAAVLACTLAACTPGPEASEPPSGTAPAPTQSQGPLVTSLQVETHADSARFVLQVTNSGTTPLRVVFSSGQSYDFVVRQGGRELWRWSADMGFTQAVREETWAPGETRTFTEAWRFPAGTRGDFTAVARLTSSTHPAEQTAAFRLP